MVIVGGAGTLLGPMLGAAFFMLMEHQLSSYTEAWAHVLRPDLHRLRAVRARRHLGLLRRMIGRRTSADAAAGTEAWLSWNCEALTKRYGALVAVDDVTMQVEEGEVRAVIGPNGAGKTTLFHLITGWSKPTTASVRSTAIASRACRRIASASSASREPFS